MVNLKGLYTEFEDKYYTLLEKIDHVVPITKLTDKIDKIVPSFSLFLAIIFLLILFFATSLFPVGPQLLIGGNSNIVVTIEDELGQPVSNATVILTYLGNKETKTTTDNGKVTLNVPIGSTLKIEAEKDNFEKRSRVLEVEDSEIKFSITIVSIVKRELKIIKLLKPDGSSMINEQVRVSFSCSNPNSIAPASVVVSNGIVEVNPDPNCGELLVQATSTGFKTLGAQKALSPNNEIYLQEFEQPKGIVKVIVRNKEGKSVSNVNVLLHKATGVEAFKGIAQQGNITFENVIIGDYYVSINDPNGTYALGSTQPLNVKKNEQTFFDVVLSKEIKGTLTISVRDVNSGALISNARVKLYLNKNDPPIATKTSGSDGLTQFRLTDEGKYFAAVYNEDYLLATADLEFTGNVNLDVKMEKLTSENSGRIEVLVRDEDGRAVENAQVFLFDAVSNYLHPIDPVLTNATGKAVFKGVKSGKYYARAIKGITESQSPAKNVDIRGLTSYTIDFVRGNGTVKLNVVDVEGKGIAFSNVEVFIDGKENFKNLTNNEGKLELNVKGGSRIYFVVSKDGYSNWTSLVVSVLDSEEIELTAILEVTIPGREPTIELVGFFKNEVGGSSLSVLESGSAYYARLIVRVPIDYDYNVLRVHLRTGDSELLEKDNAFIKDAFGASAFITRGTSFNPPNGKTNDFENITFGDAKWTELMFRGVRSGIYNVAAKVQVKAQVVSGDKIPFYYRVWGVTQDNEFLRDPIDVELGSSESISSKDGFYAKANEKVFWEGEPELCDGSFCYSGERILNKEDRLFLIPPYQLEVFGKYKLQFDITNNSEAVHNNAEIRIKNASEGKIVDDTLEIQSYRIVNADAQVFNVNNTSLYKLPPISLGNFVKNRSIVGEIDFVPKKIGNSNFELQVVSDGKIVFTKIILVSIVSNKNIIIEYEPKIIGAFVDTVFNLTAKDEEGIAISDSEIDLYKITNDNTKIKMLSKKTSKTGRVTFTLPSSVPNSKFLIIAKKTGYASEELMLSVTDRIIEFNPEAFYSKVNLSDKPEEELITKAKNLLQSPLKISNVLVKGYFKGYLDEIAMNNYVSQLVGTPLNYNEPKNIALVKTIMSNESGIIEKDKVEGEVVLTLSNESLAKDWVFTFPLKVDVGVGKGVSSDKCLIVEGLDVPNWDSISSGGRIATEFEIVNRCLAGNNEMTLKNLRAELEWTGNNYGQVELSLTNTENGENLQELLVEGTDITFFSTIPPAKSAIFSGILYFTPKPGTSGNNADFKVKILADVETDSGLKEVEPNKEINAKIAIVDFAECIKITPDPDIGLTIDNKSEEGLFEIDVSECGGKKLDISLCHNDPSCKGGTKEGGINLTPKEPIYGLSGKKEVKVKRSDIAGIYGVQIYARTKGKSFTYAKTLDVIVEPIHNRQYFYLDRYSFELLREDSVDTTTLFNSRVSEPIKVTANLCDWGESTKHNWGQGLMTGTLSGVGAMAILMSVGLAVGWAVLIAVVVVIIVMIAMSILTKEDCHDNTRTETLYDWVINLSDDSKTPSIDEEFLNISWAQTPKEVGFFAGDNERVYQSRGVKFENLGLKDVADKYAIAEFRAIEHIHGDPAHNQGNVTCKTSNFGPYNIPLGGCAPVEDKEYVQKFHLRFKTFEKQDDLPPVGSDVFECVSGTLHGRTGPGAIPKIKLGWSWNETLPEGISMRECEVGNNNYIYCDSTQFSIMLFKRLQAFNKFLKVNGGDFGCPDGPADSMESENSTSVSQNLSIGNFGINTLITNFSEKENNLDVKVRIGNLTAEPKAADLLVRLYDFEKGEEVKSCSITGISIAADSNVVDSSCKFYGLLEGQYYLSAALSSADEALSVNEPTTAIVVLDKPNENECWAVKTTQDLGGESMLRRYLEGRETFNYPNDWEATVGPKSIDTVLNLMQFDSYLIKDGYSQDFRNDFSEYYTIRNFADTPDYFSKESEGAFKDYFLDNSKMSFSRKYLPGNYFLDAPGLYKVNVNVGFGENWNFFDDNGAPNGLINVEFYKIKKPVPNSPFYNTPFDGMVGIQGTSFNRQGYGSSFVNLTEEILINDSLTQDNPKTYSDSGSNPIAKVITETERDFRRLNTSLSSRGNVFALEINGAKQERKFIFSPSMATPVVLRTRHGLDKESFQARYTLGVNGEQQETGSILTYWDGGGACRDFSGVLVSERFDYTPDRAARDSDNFPEWERSYLTEWDRAVIPTSGTGDVYLKTIFYTPRKSESILHSVSESTNMTFLTPDFSGNNVILNGISGMRWNNSGNSDFDKIDSLKDIFEMVASKKVCITNTGLKARYWWNPKAVYTQSGNERNIHVELDALQAGETCIG